MRLGKLLSVGEIAEQAPAEEPAAPARAPAGAAARDDYGQVPAAVLAARAPAGGQDTA